MSLFNLIREKNLKRRPDILNRLRWLWVWLVQIAAMALLSLLASLSFFLSGALYGICLWLLLPLAGAVSAYLATVKGLLNYAAWLAPAIVLVAVHALLYGYAPHLGQLFLLAFVSLGGAAAGVVVKRGSKKTPGFQLLVL